MAIKSFLAALLAFCLFIEAAPRPSAFRAGKDFALFFAVKDYDHHPDLTNPIKDARAIAELLRDKYDFQTEVIENPNRGQIRQTIRLWQQKSFAADAQLFIFFTGHSLFDEVAKKGFFIPRDGKSDDTFGDSYLSYPDLERDITAIPCRHILLGIDACFSGTFDEGIAFNKMGKRPGETDDSRREARISELLRDQSRFVFTSGEKRKTSDGIDHSPLAGRLLTILKNGNAEDGYLAADELKSKLRKISPPPPFTTFEGHGVDGDFLFVEKKAAQKSLPAMPTITNDGDDRLFEKAKKSGQIVDFEEYIDIFPMGRHRAEADLAISILKKNSTEPKKSSSASDCSELKLNLEAGNLNGIKPTASKEEIKKFFPCFSGETEEGEGAFNCGGGVFFLKHDFYFYTHRDYIEVRKGFAGIVNPSILGLEKDLVMKALGQPDKRGYSQFMYKKPWGTIRIEFEKNKANLVALHAQPIGSIKDCE